MFLIKLGDEFIENSPPFYFLGDYPYYKRGTMIDFVAVQLKDIFEQGKDFPWVRPVACSRCHHFKVWGHGFVPRFFDGFAFCLYMKCYRCPLCRCVMTSRPDTHFSRIRCCKETIRFLLALRIKAGSWLPSSLPPPRMRHWLANLKRQTLAHLADTWKDGPIAAFDCLLGMGHVPVSRFI